MWTVMINVLECKKMQFYFNAQYLLVYCIVCESIQKKNLYIYL